jgi:hypothetical protein
VGKGEISKIVSEKNHMKKLSSVALIFFIGFTGAAFGQTAKEAIEAMQKLSSRCETGISYKDYSAAVGEANFNVKSYLENPESGKNPNLKESIQKTWGHFLMAKEAWDLRFARVGMAVIPELLTPGKGFTGQSDKEVMSKLISIYPELSQKLIDGNSLALTDVVQVAWSYAAKELNFASRLLALQPEKKQPANFSPATESMESKLDQIEQLKTKGKITDKEYRVMRKRILSEATK